MHYYQHSIGDYRRDTMHLSLLEHGVYRQLLDLYYLNECELNANALRLICARSTEEIQAAESVLNEFFERTENGYKHKRCDAEIERYQNKSKKAKASADARWNAKLDGDNANAMRTHSECNANQEPITNNQKEQTHIADNLPSVEPSKVALVCVAILKIYRKHNHPPTDIGQANPTLLALVDAGASVGEFEDAAEAAMLSVPKKGFAWILGRVLRMREQASQANIVTGDFGKKKKPWFLVASEIEAMAKKHGLDMSKTFPYLKTEVYKLEGVTEQMVNNAKADFEGKRA